MGIALVKGSLFLKASNKMLRFREKNYSKKKKKKEPSLSEESQSTERVISISGYSYFTKITISLIKLNTAASQVSFLFLHVNILKICHYKQLQDKTTHTNPILFLL